MKKLNEDQLIDVILHMGSNQHPLMIGMSNLHKRFLEIENKLDIWVDINVNIPTEYPVLIRTNNNKYMVVNKQITNWTISKYNITHWKQITPTDE